MKKKTEVNESTNSTIPEAKFVIVHGVQPLELSLDFGRADLNEAVGKLQDKINEIIGKI